MRLSNREFILSWIAAVAILAGLTYMLVVMPRLKDWKKLIGEKAEIERKIAMTQRLVAQQPRWEARLEQQRRNLPRYPAEKDVTADVLIKLENLAGERNLKLLSREVQKETSHGDFYDMSVECKWEGNLEGLVSFLFELQQEHAMLDASLLSVAPNEKRVLRGSLTVNSAYCRAPPAHATNAPPAKVEGK